MSNLYYFGEYISYKISSLTKYKIHSPFIFKLVTEVFEKEVKYDDYERIEQIRDGLLHDKRVIEVNDLGAGSKTFTSKMRAVSKIARRSVKKEKYAHLLYMMIRHYKANTILELGTSLGITTAYLASAHRNVHVYTIEGCKNIASIAEEGWKKLLLRNIDLTVGNFDDVLKDVCIKAGKLDLVFIDGNHREIPTINYFKIILPYCHNDTVIVLDDIHWSEEMEEAWEYIKNHEKVRLTVDIFQMGIVFLREEFRAKQHMQISY